jgi:pyruvate kinase
MNSNMHIITKMETHLAVEEYLAEIIAASDGIMVARGDLGTDIPIEELPAYQDEIVARCRDSGKPVIVATHMLESMSTFPLPTRAEVTDVAHAATSKADATMLSGETASGKHPVKCVEMMDRILRATEAHLSREQTPEAGVHNDREARAEAAVTLARATGAHAIIAITRTGQTPRDVSRFRPSIPIIACTPSLTVQRHLMLVHGTFPLIVELGTPETTIEACIRAARNAKLLDRGMRVVLLADTLAKTRPISTIQMRDIA